MFNSILTIANESNDTLFNPGSIRIPIHASPHRLPDTARMLAAAGVPAHAIREVLASRTYTGADG